MINFFSRDNYDFEKLGIISTDHLMLEENAIKEIVSNFGNANLIFFEPKVTGDILKIPQEYYNNNSDKETLAVMRGIMHIQDAIWYCGTKIGLSQNPKMFSNRLHRLFPKDRDFRSYSRIKVENLEEKEREEREKADEERRKKIANEKAFRHKEEIEFAARVMAHQEARSNELNHLATEESDKLGFLFKECGKMILSLNKMPVETIDNNYLRAITIEQSKNFNFAYQQFMKFIDKEKKKKENATIKPRERTRYYNEI